LRNIRIKRKIKKHLKLLRVSNDMAEQYIHNPRQGNYKRILCVCSLGLMRSPTLAQALQSKGHNTRSCGSDIPNALIPISKKLVEWADEVVFVNPENYNAVSYMIGSDKPVKLLNIPDDYNYRDEALMDICIRMYEAA